MTIWYKQGVLGLLHPKAQKALGRLARAAEHDLYVTSLQEGTHSAGSFHHIGRAFDIRYVKGLSRAAVIEAVGSGFDVVFHETHIHVEYDPK